MRISEIAKEMGCSRQWLNKRQKRDGLPGLALRPSGRLQVVDPVALDQWLNRDPFAKAARAALREFRGTRNIIPRLGRHPDCRAIVAVRLLLEPQLPEWWPEFERIRWKLPVGEAR